MTTLAVMWDSGEVLRPAHPLRRAAALALDTVLLGWFLAWLLLPLPGLQPWTMLLLAGLYLVLGEGWRGHTIGKKALALEVRSATAGGPAGMRRALVRFAVRAAPVVPVLAAWAWTPPAVARAVTVLALAALATDHVWALRHPLGRTVHDLAAATVVLQRPREKLFQLDEAHPWAAGRERCQDDSPR